MTEYADEALKSVSRHSGELKEIAGKLWENPETRFEEKFASELLAGKLAEEGFRVIRGVGGLPTAFAAVYGEGGPVIGFLGEYDALPNLSQEAGTAERRKNPENSSNAGHGCGHHLLGTGLMGAAVALKEYLESAGMPGKVVFYGCPAEEGGSGKVWMLKRGVFDEADVLFSWHPDCINRVCPDDVLATVAKEYYFHGIASHAGSAPELGRGALEAAELMAVGLGFLREHLPGTARVHYAYLNAGGAATNIIQPEAGVAYQIRSPKISEAQRIALRIDDLARGAALMTGTKVDIHFQRATSELRVNGTLNGILHEALTEIGRPEPDEESLRLARQLYDTLPEGSRGRNGEHPLDAAIDQSDVKGIFYNVSTDVGDVSMAKPVGFLNAACYVRDIPLHTWQTVAFGKTSFAMDGMLTAARVIGAAAIRIICEPELIAAAKEEWEKQNAADPYVSPMPDEAEPEIRSK